MQMVAASKLRKAQDAQRDSQPYSIHLHQLLVRLARSLGSDAHPLITARTPVRKVLLLVYTSDRGLCAGFNNNLLKFADRWLAQHRDAFEDIAMSFCGRRGFGYFRKRGVTVDKHYEGATAAPSFAIGNGIAEDLAQAFLDGTYDEVYMVYNQFKSALSQQPVIQKLLPIGHEEVEGEGEAFGTDYIFEPNERDILEALLPKTVSFKVYYGLLENAAGEHGARMTAMDNATTNADNLIDRYTLMRNRARQAAITTELTEIVSGAEAL